MVPRRRVSLPFLEKSSVFKVRIFYQLYVDATTQLQTTAMRTCGDLDKSWQSKSYDILWLLNIKKQFFKTNILWAQLNRPETDVPQGLPVSTLWGNLSPQGFPFRFSASCHTSSPKCEQDGNAVPGMFFLALNIWYHKMQAIREVRVSLILMKFWLLGWFREATTPETRSGPEFRWLRPCPAALPSGHGGITYRAFGDKWDPSHKAWNEWESDRWDSTEGLLLFRVHVEEQLWSEWKECIQAHICCLPRRN